MKNSHKKCEQQQDFLHATVTSKALKCEEVQNMSGSSAEFTLKENCKHVKETNERKLHHSKKPSELKSEENPALKS